MDDDTNHDPCRQETDPDRDQQRPVEAARAVSPEWEWRCARRYRPNSACLARQMDRGTSRHRAGDRSGIAKAGS
jgi:hypothetical protein